MKYLKKYENVEYKVSDLMPEFSTKLLGEIENEAYGFYDLQWKEERGDYTIKALFVEFDKGSAEKMSQLSERFGYDWDMEIEYLETVGDDGIERWKYYMVVRYVLEEDTMRDIFEDMDITQGGIPTSQMKKYNL